jgi:alpha-mannosidase
MLNPKILVERFEKWLSPIYWTQCNIRSALYGPRVEVFELKVYEPEDLYTKLSIDEVKCNIHKFKNTAVGSSFGPSWSTKWFYLKFNVPDYFKGHMIGLMWNSSTEAMLYDIDGRVIQGFTGGESSKCRDLYIISDSFNATGKENHVIEFYIEMSCNDLFGNGQNGMIMPPNPNKVFTLTMADIVIVNSMAHKLFWDMKVIYDIITLLGVENNLSAQCIGLATKIINKVNLSDPQSLAAAHEEIDNTFFSRNVSRISPRSHEILAVGHCHIDTAWLWTYKDTRRKVIRSWSTQLELLRRYPDWKFVASQTVQYEWLKMDCSELYNRIKENITTSGGFLPIGGSYVEFDANIPSGESMIRQLLYGTEFLENEFNLQTKVFWLPDTFGYSGQLPQILKGFNIPYFLSQKLSWNLYNKYALQDILLLQ